MIPKAIKYQIDQYIEAGVTPSSFLYAILTNDLMVAIQKADDINKLHIPDIVAYLRNYLPVGSYGNIGAVLGWLQAHRHGAESIKEAIAHDRDRRRVYYEGRRTSS